LLFNSRPVTKVVHSTLAGTAFVILLGGCDKSADLIIWGFEKVQHKEEVKSTAAFEQLYR
jgi:hypothetical protein